MWRGRILIIFAVATLIGLIAIYIKQSKIILAQEVTSWTQDHHADCAVVLTGGPGRVREGFNLLAQGRVRKLIISGVYHRAELREIFPQWPFYGSINEEDVVLEKRSTTTYGNAQQSLPLVEAFRCKNIILVTSKLHMYRSLNIFRTVFPTDFQIYDRAIVAGRLDPTRAELLMEVTKSLFYALWAY
ncbi:MAG: hypothetical protein A2Z20_06245 [Bdellovibrionales bacterium RBG_16_40_8]|nr:MAG: hypothetical protein A2Z20_06245 [Bdellovibrionales bacterium RBG_16_40_8]